MPRARAHDGLSLHYDVLGEEGPWVVLIHGLTLSGRFWFDQPQRLVARGYRVLWFDNRGTGRSEAIRGRIGMSTLARDVIAVMDAAKVERAHVAGISMGGMIAQHVALDHGSRVETLLLMATTCGLPHGSLPSPRTMAALVEMPFARGTKRGAEIMAHLLLPPHDHHRFAELFARWPEAFNADPQRKATFFYQIGAVLGHSVGARLSGLRVPTMVVTGAEDVLVLPKNSQTIARLIPDAELDVLPGVGHSIPSVDPEVIERSLARLRQRTARTEGAAARAEATQR